MIAQGTIIRGRYMFEHENYLLEKQESSKQKKRLSIAAMIGAVATVIAETILLDVPFGTAIAKLLAQLL